MKKAKKSRSKFETRKRPHQKKGGRARSSRPHGRRESGVTAIAPSVPAKIVDASKQEAQTLSQSVENQVRGIERNWWQLGKLVDTCLKRHVPRALGLTAKQWMEKYLEGSLSDAFRKMRVIRGLAGVPEEKINAMKQANAQQLCRLPEGERKSEEWVDRAASEPISDFKESVDKRLEERGIPVEKFDVFYIKGPAGVIEKLREAEKKVAGLLSIDIELKPALRAQAWEAIAAMLLNTSEEVLQVEMVGRDS